MSSLINQNGQSKMIDGVNKVVDAVKVTLGPKGKCVAIMKNFNDIPDITRDGATVAKSIVLKDCDENIGASLVKSAAKATEEAAGDGTSSTSVLIQDIIKQGQQYLMSGVNMNEVKSGMDKTVSWVTKYISDNAISVDGDLEKIRRVATISANNDPEVGDLIVQCMEKVGENGVIVSEMSSSLDTKIEVVEGFKIERGWSNPHFVTNPEEGKCIMENPAILVVSEKISSIPQIYNLLEVTVKSGRPFLIVCDDMDDIVMTTLIMNVLQGALRCCVVKGIDFGDNRKNIMEDLAVSVGAQHICPEYGLKVSDAREEQLGSACKVVISKDSCIVYGGAGDRDDIDARVEILKTRLSDSSVSSYEKSKIEKRVSSLSGGIGIIRAGGASEAEKRNKKDTIEDAILASKSAISEGVVPGGGYIFLKASQEGSKYFSKVNLTPDEKIGVNIVLTALKSIIKTIGENSGINGDVLIERLSKNLKGAYGYNAKLNKFGDLLEMGVLDSAKVLRVSLENAVSTASMCLLTTCTITDEEEKK